MQRLSSLPANASRAAAAADRHWSGACWIHAFQPSMHSSPVGCAGGGHAENGAEAQELADELDPHVVTMDIDMPILDGVEATKLLAKGREIKRRGRKPGSKNRPKDES